MERQNVTLSLSKTLIKQAKILATQEDKSLNELVRETLQQKVDQSTGYMKAQRRHAATLKKGLNLGTQGRWSIAREELHARG